MNAIETLREAESQARQNKIKMVEAFKREQKIPERIKRARERIKAIERAIADARKIFDQLLGQRWNSVGGADMRLQTLVDRFHRLSGVPAQIEQGIQFVDNLRYEDITGLNNYHNSTAQIKSLLEPGDVIGELRHISKQVEDLLEQKAATAQLPPEMAPRLVGELKPSEPAQQWDPRFSK
jgi:DNA repair exonuclease SbcCD ATPase subunit